MIGHLKFVSDRDAAMTGCTAKTQDPGGLLEI